MLPSPPLTALRDLDGQLQSAGFAVLDSANVSASAGVTPAQLRAWQPHWDDLPFDEYLLDDGKYRRRRFGAFVVEEAKVEVVPDRPHWQSADYNALHGGIERWFQPLPDALVRDSNWHALLRALAQHASVLRGPQPWFVEAHTFRIEATGGIGRPTPEGAHRDGVDLVAVLMVDRHNILGGETRVFDIRGPQGMRFTMAEPWSALLLDDERVIHESTPIRPLQPGQPAWRDTLVLTLRQQGFQA